MTSVVAAFDFDGTLTRRDTLAPFLTRSHGPARVAGAVMRHGPALASAAMGRGDRDRAKAELLHTLYAGTDVATAVEFGQRYATQVLARRMRNDTLARLEWHRRAGHELILITASLALYAEPIAERLGIPTVFATRLAHTDGVFTGSLDGANMRGPEKARVLDEHLADSDAIVWAYGDSSGDRELLARADHGILVKGVHIPAAPATDR